MQFALFPQSKPEVAGHHTLSVSVSQNEMNVRRKLFTAHPKLDGKRPTADKIIGVNLPEINVNCQVAKRSTEDINGKYS
jgi:hypothetical protein